MAKNYATPWRFEPDEHEKYGIVGYDIIDANSGQVVGCEGIIDATPDRAAFIVRAVNAHDALVAALRENAWLLSLVVNDLQGRVEAGKLSALIQCLDRANDAIAKATL